MDKLLVGTLVVSFLCACFFSGTFLLGGKIDSGKELLQVFCLFFFSILVVGLFLHYFTGSSLAPTTAPVP